MPDSNLGGGMWEETVQLYAEVLESHSDLQAALDVAMDVAIEAARQHKRESQWTVRVTRAEKEIIITIASG